MDKKSKDRLEITELIIAKIDCFRKFIGEINRYTEDDGRKFVAGKVFVKDGYIWSKAVDSFELNKFLDNILY